MNRIDQCFKALAEQSKKAVIPYVTAGYPTMDSTVDVLHAMVEAGADIIELGIPFSDPMADGPVIQKACEVSLENGVTLRKVLEMIETFRSKDSKTPIVLMGYLNPFEAFGYQDFAEAAAKAGVDGVLAVDLPPEASDILQPALEKQDLKCIYLLAPTSTEARVKEVAKSGSGYVYYVSLKGVTGSATLDTEDVKQQIERLKAHITIPICVGFGISDGASAKAVGQFAEGVIVGSAYIKTLAKAKDKSEILANTQSLTAELVSGVASI